MSNWNIGNNELLEELGKRINEGKIGSSLAYCYETDEIRVEFKTADTIHFFSSNLDIEKQFRYYKDYRTFCLPLINEKQKIKLNQELEILKTKINYDRN